MILTEGFDDSAFSIRNKEKLKVFLDKKQKEAALKKEAEWNRMKSIFQEEREKSYQRIEKKLEEIKKKQSE